MLSAGEDLLSTQHPAPSTQHSALSTVASHTFSAFVIGGAVLLRAFHRRPLWRIHAVHHSAVDLDWLAATRVHPLNEIGMRLFQVVPLYLLGFRGGALAAVAPVLAMWAVVVHDNLSWDLGPLRYVFTSPAFHRWHHTSEEEGLDKNFAGLFPWIDALFGTFYMPRGRQPLRFGLKAGSDDPAFIPEFTAR